MALRGNPSSIQALKAKLKALPRTLAQEVAQRGAPVMTTAARTEFDAGRTVYDALRPRGVDGAELSLVRTGTTRRELRFRQLGTQIRCVLPTRYAKYLIGKYSVLPNGPLPAGWAAKLGDLVREVGKGAL